MKKSLIFISTWKATLKRKIIFSLVWLINKIDPSHVHIKRFEYAWKIALNQMRYVPNDGKWHHLAITLESWVKKNKKFKTTSKKKQGFFIDGVLVKVDQKKKLKKKIQAKTKPRKRK